MIAGIVDWGASMTKVISRVCQPWTTRGRKDYVHPDSTERQDYAWPSRDLFRSLP